MAITFPEGRAAYVDSVVAYLREEDAEALDAHLSNEEHILSNCPIHMGAITEDEARVAWNSADAELSYWIDEAHERDCKQI